MPICLPIYKLASLPATPKSAQRFQNDLLLPNSERTHNASYLRSIYNKIASEWNTADERGQALFASTEPKMRELLLGMEGSREAKLAAFDFNTASVEAHSGSYESANAYLSYALAKLATKLNDTKLGYGYDIGGQVSEGGGTSGNGKHLWDTSNSGRNNKTPSNPGANVFDAEAESDYPELAAFKHKRVQWPPRTR